MSTPETVLAQIRDLIDKANAATGRVDTNLTAAVEALIAGYGKGGGCSHETICSANGDDTHTVTVKCGSCGKILSEKTETCTDDNSDGLCDICGGDMICPHTQTQISYSANGDETHTVTETCTQCGSVVSQSVAACQDEDNDLKCDICGGSVACQHSSITIEISAGGDGAHVEQDKCNICGEYIGMPIVATCQDSDGDGLCDKCGCAICSHENRSTGYTPGGDGTHVTKTICAACKAVISQVTEDCTDTNGDGLCDVCGEQMEQQTDDAVYSYAVGELNGLYGYYMTVNGSNKLECTKSTSYGVHVAVGALNGSGETLVSNQSIQAVPIPAKASKLTITVGNTNTSKVKAVFISGEPSQVGGYAVIESTAVADQVCSLEFAAGAWDYVVFNFAGSWSSQITAPYAGTKASMIFE